KVGLAGHQFLQVRDAAFGLNGIVIGGLVAVRTTPAVTIAIGIDDVGPDRLYGGIVQAQLAYRLAPHRMDDDISRGDQAAQRFLAALVPQVQHHTALAAIDVGEYTAKPRSGPRIDIARVVTGGRFDLDDVGA